MTENRALAAILDHPGTAKVEPDQVLAALVDHGVFVPVTGSGEVMLLQGEDRTPLLPGYVSEACCAERLPAAAGSYHCDALRLLDLVERTGVNTMALHGVQGLALVHVPALYQTLRRRGQRGQGERLKLTWSTDPVAVALRAGLMRRIREFPAIRSSWVSRARWLGTGMEHLMVHMAVDEELPSGSAQRLMEILLAEEVALGPDAPRVAMLALNTVRHADTITELCRMGLDTVRIDDAGRVEVVSREFDGPGAAAGAAKEPPPLPRHSRRWWQRRVD